MVVTEQAAEALAEQLSARQDEECFRLILTDEGPGVTLDGHRPGDEVIRHEEKVILALEPEVAEQMGELVLDVERSKAGHPQLVILEAPQR